MDYTVTIQEEAEKITHAVLILYGLYKIICSLF